MIFKIAIGLLLGGTMLATYFHDTLSPRQRVALYMAWGATLAVVTIFPSGL